MRVLQKPLDPEMADRQLGLMLMKGRDDKVLLPFDPLKRSLRLFVQRLQDKLNKGSIDRKTLGS